MRLTTRFICRTSNIRSARGLEDTRWASFDARAGWLHHLSRLHLLLMLLLRLHVVRCDTQPTRMNVGMWRGITDGAESKAGHL
jgi:hypothetical protein